jgi:hypothetical protein
LLAIDYADVDGDGLLGTNSHLHPSDHAIEQHAADGKQRLDRQLLHEFGGGGRGGLGGDDPRHGWMRREPDLHGERQWAELPGDYYSHWKRRLQQLCDCDLYGDDLDGPADAAQFAAADSECSMLFSGSSRAGGDGD